MARFVLERYVCFFFRFQAKREVEHAEAPGVITIDDLPTQQRPINTPGVIAISDAPMQQPEVDAAPVRSADGMSVAYADLKG